jgi:saccharopine dehydrogenase-like NADP-dependent oxidoreductase
MTSGQLVIIGTGSFAARILFDAAATADAPVTITIAGRNRERLAWLRTAANARAILFRRPARIVAQHVDLLSADATEHLFASAGSRRPAASAQTPR